MATGVAKTTTMTKAATTTMTTAATTTVTMTTTTNATSKCIFLYITKQMSQFHHLIWTNKLQESSRHTCSNAPCYEDISVLGMKRLMEA